MGTFALSRFALTMCAAAALLAGCGGSQPPVGAPGAMLQNPALAARSNTTNYKVVYSFGGAPDGDSPLASLIDVGGTLYGTTKFGGAIGSPPGGGTIFSLTTAGAEKVVYNFGSLIGGYDGREPVANLTDLNGTLYGTTLYGGSLRLGTVFSFTTAGTEKVVYNFSGDRYPAAGLIDLDGTLYGTTSGGYGSAFSITTGGTYKDLCNFSGGNGDHPVASLIDIKGVLYGTTAYGGAHGRRYGTVFNLTTGGIENVLHSFGKGSDGRQPLASLIKVKRTLYGTTLRGGTYHRGTVFSLTLGGTEKVFHSFGNGTDGVDPAAPLVDVKGTLYGTTEFGGAYSCGMLGCGTVFSITPGGSEKLLHSFGYGADGNHPEAGLIDVGGTLYGTTVGGGTHNHGTVFALTP